MHRVYCSPQVNLFLLLLQFALCAVNLIIESADVDDLTANTITLLFFTHSIVKMVYFAVRTKYFYKTWAIWNNPNSHPLFAESNARYHAISLKKMRLLLFMVGGTTVLSAVAWTVLTFFEHPIRTIVDPVTNETEIIQVMINDDCSICRTKDWINLLDLLKQENDYSRNRVLIKENISRQRFFN